jgi:Tfp pilus assembly protein PilO
MNLSILKSLPSLDKVELKPSTMLLGLGGVLLVAYLVIGASYLKGRQEQSSLREQIQAGGGTLSGVGGSQQTLKDLQDRLAQAQGNLTSLENALPQEMDSPALVEGLLAYAAQSNVRIRQMNALPPQEVKAAGKEGGSGYMALSYTLVVNGSLPDLLAFLSRIEGDITHTVAINDLGLTPVEGGQEMKVGVSFYATSASKEATPGAAATIQATPNGGEQP